MDGGTAFVLLLVFVALAAALWFGRRERERRIDRWRSWAGARGGEVRRSDAGLFSTGRLEAEIDHGDARVLVDTYEEAGGESARTFTRAQAAFVLGEGPALTVYPDGLFATLGKTLGLQDLEIGHAAFDRQFIVQGEDLEVTRLALAPVPKEPLLTRFTRPRLESDGALVGLRVEGVLRDEAALDDLVATAAALASHGVAPLRALAELPRATFVPATGPWEAREPPRLEVETGGGPVRIDVVARACPQLRLRIALPRAIPTPFSVEVGPGGALPPETPEGLLPEEAAALLAGVEGATLSAADRRLRLAFPAVPPRAQVERGVALLAAVAAGARRLGAFR